MTTPNYRPSNVAYPIDEATRKIPDCGQLIAMENEIKVTYGVARVFDTEEEMVDAIIRGL
ncbi:dihydroxy-acid dehydratase [Glaciimonas immobilis]|uniref:Uncharacterized protein n=1 Tax=Glaciimonas immobilis TaxID=728004 RepID=A0A840RUE5_9BURK|nr:dihydroxy-acid dehydratase [Glaciimonas immobilis]KAF3997534.1 dihydroxy-acid dehydratase [Glaciimonas immobilis]MBB5200782.1 hypothetical protein [Glaciimonas immobilis]